MAALDLEAEYNNQKRVPEFADIRARWAKASETLRKESKVDLDLGYGFTDMPGDYVRRDLRLMGMFWTARQPMGMTALPEAALALAPAIRLAWLMGRVEIDGLAPANVF